MDIPVSNSLFKYDPSTSFISDIFNSGFKLHYATGIVETKGNTIYKNSDDAVGGFIGYYKSRGLYGVPTICVSGDVSGSISAYHHDGVGYLETSRIVQGSFSAAIGATRIGGIYELWLRPDVAGAGLAKVFDISSSGNATILGSLTASTYSGLTFTSLATGFSVAGGTAPKTLTVSNDADVSGTNTGDASGHTGLVPYTGATGAVDLGSQTLSSGGETIVKNALGTTSTDGQVITNNTLAIVGTPVQISPRIRERGSAWNTTSGASETVDYIQELSPVSGTSVSGIYRIGFSINGGAYSYPFTFNSAGDFAINRDLTIGTGRSIFASASSTGTLIFGDTSTKGNSINRNRADAFTTFTIDNVHASSTGNILNCQWQSVTRASISREGTVSAKGLKLIAVTIDDTDSPYAVLASDYTLICDSEDGDITINLPACDGGGRILNIKKIHENNTVTITPNATDTIDGEATWDVTIKYENIQIQDVGFWAIL